MLDFTVPAETHELPREWGGTSLGVTAFTQDGWYMRCTGWRIAQRAVDLATARAHARVTVGEKPAARIYDGPSEVHRMYVARPVLRDVAASGSAHRSAGDTLTARDDVAVVRQ